MVSGMNSGYEYYNMNMQQARGIVSEPVNPVSPVNPVEQVNPVAQNAPADVVIDNENKAPRVSNPNNFEFDFKKSNDFNLVGANSKLEDLDVEQELSEMKKDSILDQYKFFVPSTLGQDEDGLVRQVVRQK